MSEPKNIDLEQSPTPDTPLKKWMVNYVGDKHSPEDERVTVEMIVDTIAEEFPEFLLVVAEENWIRGYKQAMLDIEDGTRALRDRGKERLQQKNIEKSVSDAVNAGAQETIQNDKE